MMHDNKGIALMSYPCKLVCTKCHKQQMDYIGHNPEQSRHVGSYRIVLEFGVPRECEADTININNTTMT
jgi:hypothetical protein